MSKGNPFLALWFPREQQEALRARATESGQTLSDLVRQIPADHVADQRPHKKILEAQSRTQKAILVRRPRKLSRPARLRSAIASLEDLLADYEDWRANQPDSLQDGSTAAVLADTIDNLQQAVDLLNEITPPRGFGRD